MTRSMMLIAVASALLCIACGQSPSGPSSSAIQVSVTGLAVKVSPCGTPCPATDGSPEYTVTGTVVITEPAGRRLRVTEVGVTVTRPDGVVVGLSWPRIPDVIAPGGTASTSFNAAFYPGALPSGTYVEAKVWSGGTMANVQVALPL
jgi:hypothetical protein